MDEIVPLTPKHKNSLHDAVADPVAPPPFALMGNVNPNMRVFVVHFDGTQNDKENIPDGSIATLVANSHDFMNTNESLASRYYAGVGTRTSTVRGLLESVTGMGAVNRAERAYSDLCEQTKAWRKENPECEVHVHVVGFSRGSGIGLHFMNLVHNRGIRESGKSWKAQENLGPGDVKTSAVLFDAVTTGNSNLSLTLPPSNVATLHVTAGGEERMTFPLTTLRDPSDPDELAMVSGIFMGGQNPESNPMGYQRLTEVSLGGARHSDVGGSYPQGGIRQVSAYLMGEFQRNLGLPVQARKPTFEEIEKMHANDSRFLINKIGDPFKSEENQVEARQSANRTVIHRGQREWDGDAVVKCKLKDGDGTELGFVRYQHCKLKQHDWGKEIEDLRPVSYASTSTTLDEDLFHMAQPVSNKAFKTDAGLILPKEAFSSTTELTLQLAREGTPAERLFHGMEIVGEKASAIEISSDGSMTYHGLKLPSEYSPDRLREMMLHATDNRITLCVEMEKTTPVFNAGQRPVSTEEAQKIGNFLGGLSFQDDPWPAAVRDALYKLNDPNDLVSNKEAQMMKYRAMEAMSTRLLNAYGEGKKTDSRGEFIVPGHEIESISWKSNTMGNRQTGFHIEIQRKDGSVIRDDDPGHSAEDYMFITEMKSAKAAMHMLDERLVESGHLTARPIHQVFSKTMDIDLSEKTMPQKNTTTLTEEQVERISKGNEIFANETIRMKNAKGEDVAFTIRPPMAVRGMGMLQQLGGKEATEKHTKPLAPH